MSQIIVAATLVWLREQPFDAGTRFAVVDRVDTAATDPVQVDAGTAALWLRHGKATGAAAPARKGRA